MRSCLFFLLISFAACKNQLYKTTNELGAVENVLATERKAHITKNVSLLISNFADTISDVSKGVAKMLALEESKKRFTNYFNSVEFLKWDDIAEPVLVFSDDSSMAVATVQKQVIVKEIGGVKIDTTYFCWAAVYRKLTGKWKLTSITSTNK